MAVDLTVTDEALEDPLVLKRLLSDIIERLDNEVLSVASDRLKKEIAEAGGITSYYSDDEPKINYLLVIGDLWYDTSDSNKAYRFDGVGWVTVRDGGIAQALSDALAAQAAADNAQVLADGKIVTFLQVTMPTTGTIGDLWIDSDDGNKLYRHNGTTFVTVKDTGIVQAITDAATAQTTADGKIVTFYQATVPTGTIGDMWVDSDDGNRLYRHNGTTFVTVKDTGIAQAISDAATAQTTADGKIVTFYQTTMPSTGTVGDMWVDSDDGNKLYRHNGTTFVTVKDTGIAAAITAASNAQATADGKIVTFYQTVIPTTGVIGDLWVDTDDGNKLYRHNGTTFVTIQDSSIAVAAGTSIWTGVTGTGKPEDNANVNAPRIAVRKNTLLFNSSANGAGYIHGFSNGVAAAIDGVVTYNGAEIAIPKTRNSGIFTFGARAVGQGYLILDTTISAKFFISGNVFVDVVYAKKSANKWSYDNGTTWVLFTPANTDIIIGTVTVVTAGIIDTAEVWPQGMSTSVVPEAGADQTQVSLEAGVDLLFSRTSMAGIDAFNSSKNYMHWTCNTGIDGYATGVGVGMALAQAVAHVKFTVPSISVLAGAVSYVFLESRRMSEGTFLEDRGLEITANLWVSGSSTEEIYMISGVREVSGGDYFGFFLEGTTLYAISYTVASGSTVTQIQTITTGVSYKYTALKDYVNGKIDYYVDEVLKTTITTTLPVQTGGISAGTDFEISLKHNVNGFSGTEFRVYDVKVVTDE